MVYVINEDSSPLMPCKPAIARLLLKDGKAKCIRRTWRRSLVYCNYWYYGWIIFRRYC